MKQLMDINGILTTPIQTFNFKDQSIKFSLPKGTVGFTLSGGLDSTTLLAFACKYISEYNLEDSITIQPFHALENLRPNTVVDVENILEIIRKKYPSVKIKDLIIYPVYSSVVYSEKKKGLDEQGKVPQMNDFYDNYCKENDISCIVMAMNCLPRKEILDEWNCSYYSQNRLERNRPILVEFDNFHYYQPMVNVDKRMTAAMFEFCQLPKSIVDMNTSCTGFPSETDYYSKPCGKCYHCMEKKWAFGKY